MKKGINTDLSVAKTFRGHYPLYAHQNSVLMVDTWMCSALPQELEIIGAPIVVRSNAFLIKKGGFYKKKKIQRCVNL